jgi:phospholipase/carboxylesterase
LSHSECALFAKFRRTGGRIAHEIASIALSAFVCTAACKSADREAPGVAPSATARSSANAPARTSGSLRERELQRAGDLYYLELVTGGAAETAELPLVLALHGLGDDPASFGALFSGFEFPARIALVRAPNASGPGYSWFELTGGDLEKYAAGIRRAADQLAVVARQIAHDRPTRGLPIVTGFSQGGALSFALAALHPNSIRAAFPVGGWLPRELQPDKAARDTARAPSVVALHGEADTRVPVQAARDAVSALERAGYKAELVTFPGVGHGMPSDVRMQLHSLLAAELEAKRF